MYFLPCSFTPIYDPAEHSPVRVIFVGMIIAEILA
jgi:hypothetical protein